MSLEVRLLVVALVVVLVVAAAAVARWWTSGRARAIEATGLEPGVYLLTSADCDTCAEARDVLRRRGVEFAELTWQGHPDVFERLSIESVPSLLAVDESGAGRWWSGPGPRRGP